MSSSISTIPKGSWILVSGATGFVASHAIGQFLERGFRVRGTVRDLNQASWLTDDCYKDYARKGDFQLIAVPDFAVDGAFDEVIRGMAAVAHLATITSFDPNPNNVIPPTVAGVRSLLNAAAKERSVLEFVFTSSVMASALPIAGNETHVDQKSWNDVAVEAAWAPPPYEASRAMLTYAASKVAAEKEVWKFAEEVKPSFNINVISPFGIIGKPLHKKHVETPANWIASVYRGDKAPLDAFPGGFFANVKDIALLHVAAILDPEVRLTRLHSWGDTATWNDFLDILRKLRPQRDFMMNYANPAYPDITTDQSDSIALLKKWGDQGSWRHLKDSIFEHVESPYFQIE